MIHGRMLSTKSAKKRRRDVLCLKVEYSDSIERKDFESEVEESGWVLQEQEQKGKPTRFVWMTSDRTTGQGLLVDDRGARTEKFGQCQIQEFKLFPKIISDSQKVMEKTETERDRDRTRDGGRWGSNERDYKNYDRHL